MQLRFANLLNALSLGELSELRDETIPIHAKETNIDNRQVQR